jgi:hypothetical protein
MGRADPEALIGRLLAVRQLVVPLAWSVTRHRQIPSGCKAAAPSYAPRLDLQEAKALLN